MEALRTLQVAVTKEYFDQIKAGSKTEEYRLANDYWKKRLQFKTFDRIVITLGYPKANDSSRRLEFAYNGWELKTITHKHFGPDPVEVFALRLSKDIYF